MSSINLSLDARRAVWERDKGVCGICGQPVEFGPKMHADHVIPRGAGGSDDLENLRATHAKCNQAQNRGGYLPHSRIIKTKDGAKLVYVVPRLGVKVTDVEATRKPSPDPPASER